MTRLTPPPVPPCPRCEEEWLTAVSTDGSGEVTCCRCGLVYGLDGVRFPETEDET